MPQDDRTPVPLAVFFGVQPTISKHAINMYSRKGEDREQRLAVFPEGSQKEESAR